MTTAIPPVRLELVVDADRELAFTVFTDGIGTWWPLADFAVHGDGTVAFEGGELVETSASGARAVWGTVTAWEPGSLVAFTWHPGEQEAAATRVSVAFDALEHGTRVTLVHEGWQERDARDSYETGWPAVLAPFRAATRDVLPA